MHQEDSTKPFYIWFERHVTFKKIFGVEHFCDKRGWSVTLHVLAFLHLAFWAERMTVFCHPTLWASVVFGYCILFYLASYFLDKTKCQILWGLSSGFTFMVFSYLVFFIGQSDESLLFILIMGIGLGSTILVTRIFVRLIHGCFFEGTIKTKISFFIPFLVGICVLISAGENFRKSAELIEQTQTENYDSLPDDFMTEHIVGMHFKYYSKCCLLDGWRPPVHEPYFVMGLWMNGMKDPMKHLKLGERLALYKKLYPDKPYKMDCACENPKWLSYAHDKLWTGEREY